MVKYAVRNKKAKTQSKEPTLGRKAGAGVARRERPAQSRKRLFQEWTAGSSRGIAPDLSTAPETTLARPGPLPEIPRNIPDE